MAEALKVFLLIISALFPIVDPLSGSPIFLALTPGIRRKRGERFRGESPGTAYS